MPLNKREFDSVVEQKPYSSSGIRGLLIGQLLSLIVLVALTLDTSASQDSKKTGRPDLAVDAAKLSAADKSELTEVLRLQAELGDLVWPGFGRAHVPIILFNDRFEFLVGKASPPAPWAVVKGDSFNGKPYHRRVASNPQGFAVGVGDAWAGSLSTLDWSNRRNPMKVTRELHVIAILHEMFHAYQAIRSPEQFKKAGAAYAAEARYPFRDPEFADTWDKEGSLLAAALKVKDVSATRPVISQFLQVRDARRARAALGPELLSFERELEWLEGMAKYVEVRLCELVVSHPAYSGWRLPYFQEGFVRLERQLGRQDGDLRFYLSGMAQGRLLDRLSQSWKEQTMQDGVYLEELLRVAVGLEKK
jgi:hypothetical protein